MGDATVRPCPVGHYCVSASEPVWCPAGRMRSTPGAASAVDCPLCRAGYYCPEDQANVQGIPCNETYECPEGSPIPQECTGGYYCPELTGNAIICPAGYYCPNATGAWPFRCNYTTYCPEGSNSTMLCPLGYKAGNDSGLRTSIADSCLICEAGFYGNHFERLTCDICPAGYYCKAGTGNPEKNPCPVGNYCPRQSGAPNPCLPGTYRKEKKAKAATDCLQCQADTFNDLSGQNGCRLCGPSSSAATGASACSCKGKDRSFQTSDGSCICRSGYLFYNSANQLMSDEDGPEDCQPLVCPLCNSSSIQNLQDCKCINPNTYNCAPACSTSTGTFQDPGRSVYIKLNIVLQLTFSVLGSFG